MKLLNINIVNDRTIFEGEIRFDNKIRSIKKLSEIPNPKLDYLLPGFIDLHVHGGGGVDVMDNGSLDAMLKLHASKGTTSLLLTTVTAKHDQLLSVFQKIENKKINPLESESKILGVHLEGPYINENKLGAQPDFTRALNTDEIDELNKISTIKVITVAPEFLSPTDIDYFHKNKMIIQLGHSDANYEQSLEAFNRGAKSVTHLYNAMSSFHHRQPGLIGASLAHAEFSEIIPDLLHVHPGAIKAALRAIPKIYFVTDATSATGMPDGEYQLGSHQVHKCQNGVRLSDGTLAGSSLDLHQALLNLISPAMGLNLAEVSYRLSTIQSELLGIDHLRGRIKEELFSDLVILDQQFQIKKVYVEGNEV